VDSFLLRFLLLGFYNPFSVISGLFSTQFANLGISIAPIVLCQTHELASIQGVVTTLESVQTARVGLAEDTDLAETFFCKKYSRLE